MEQRYDGTPPRAEIRLEGCRVIRSEVVGDWGLRIQWEVRRDGQVVATPNARPEMSYQHPDATPGTYEIALQTWKYTDYRKNAQGEFLSSRYIEISNKVRYTV